MRIFTAGLATETNTFSPLPTGWAEFEAFGLQRADAPLQPSLWAGPALLWKDLAERDGHEFVHSVIAFAAPAGLTARSVYETLRDEIVRDAVARGPFDLCLLHLHGAMVADGYDDCEGDLLAHLRRALGPRVRIGVELDPHAHLSEAMVAGADLLIAYKEYPHTDIQERAADLYRLMIDVVDGRIDPRPAVHDCRMVGNYFTQRDSVRGLVGRCLDLERGQAVSVSFIHGFPWGDVPDNGARMLVYADGDAGAAARMAEELADALWEIREDTEDAGLGLDEALDQALASPAGPVVVADAADNTGGGAPGDSTSVLRRLLERGVRDAALGPLWDPMAVAICRAAGLGARLPLRVGGKCGVHSGAPVDLEITVKGLSEDLKTPGLWGDAARYGASALVEIDGAGVHVLLTSLRMQALDPAMFAELGLDVAGQRLVVVKSFNHFRAGYAPVASRILSIAGPGSLVTDARAIPFQRRPLRYWPRVAAPRADA